MGCTQSKIENEETVARCKERKMFMKEAVAARNAFAAAHSSYAVSLKNTGAALHDYAEGEAQFTSASAAAAAAAASTSGSSSVPGSSVGIPPSMTSNYDLPPPPPLPFFTPSPLQRAATMPEISIPTPDLKHEDPIIEETEEDIEDESVHGLKHRSSKSSGGGGIGGRVDLPPPSPPRTPPQSIPMPPPSPPLHDNWDFFSWGHDAGPTLADVDEGRVEREELQRKLLEEEAKRRANDVSDGGSKGGGRRSGKEEATEVADKVAEPPTQPPPPQAAPTKVAKRVKVQAPPEGKMKSGQPANLLQIFSELDDYFLRASESAHEVSKMLEANRLHYHSNFADPKGHVDHATKVMRVITWNKSFKGMPNQDDGKDDFDSEENETHATVLDKMLAWEKKLYDEVKAGEQMKLEYQRKVASLNKLKKRGTNTEALERMKATVSHLHTRYIVDMQSMDSTVSEINRLRDDQLYPKLKSLVESMARMWETMKGHHENQCQIVLALRSLDMSQSPKETSEHHYERTYQLGVVVQEWHSQFEKMIIHQKEYIRGLNDWLKLNLVPIDTNLKEKVSSPQRPQNPPILALLHAWQDLIGKLPDELAKTAIYSFSAVVNTIVQHQLDEMKLKDRCKDTRKELEKRTRQFEDWYHKYMQRRTPNDDTEQDGPHEDNNVIERQLQLEALKQRLKEEEEAYMRQCMQVRVKSLTSLRTGLPELFHAMSEFSRACSIMYQTLESITHPLNREST
ncbi:PREDICTED: uncharacterized protein LOC109188207 [Ipomoea nil]|uniref:uncharacterized protein LOC109188207 n=1 Tax=Ipomoea nil TaxID=35883 RepID=UPI0009010380|nr:PREDICTED: uncharacterized protein LOC109188207 [Ipomoea nil]